MAAAVVVTRVGSSVPQISISIRIGSSMTSLMRLRNVDRFAAVDEAVVVGQRDVHHRADDDLAVAGDRAVLDGVQAEDAALRRIDDRRREQRAVDAAVGDRERAALQLLELELVLAGPACAKSAIACSISAKLSRSALRSTGTTSPLPPPTAMPMS